MKVIAIDPSLRSLGMFFAEDGEYNSDVIQRTEPDRIDVLRWLCLKFAKEAALGWDLCILESYAFGADKKRVGKDGKVKTFSNSVTGQAEIGGLIRGLFAARGVPIIEVQIPTWKSVTGIAMKKGTSQFESDYLNEVVKKFGIRFQTTDEADAYLLFQTVKICGTRILPGIGPAKIRQKLEDFKIDARKM